MNDIAQEFLQLAPGLAGFGLTLAVVAGILWGTYRLTLANNHELPAESRLPRQIALGILAIVGLVLVTLALPVSEGTRNQIIGLIGVLLSGLIAFSSTTIVGNLMAGLMMRWTKPFRIGDFIKVDSLFGRVTERGLLDTEIQTEHSELISVPNSFLIAHPVTTTRSSGTVVSASLSLGFDVHHSVIESLLIEATERAKLEDGFVQIMEIGDFSVSYRVSGVLTEVKSLISTRSRLMGHVLDCLHEADIEILSPNFMAQRPQPEGLKMIPPKSTSEQLEETAAEGEDTPESVVFDKANQAELAEQEMQALRSELTELEEQLGQASGDEKKVIQQSIDEKKQAIKTVQENLQKSDEPE